MMLLVGMLAGCGRGEPQYVTGAAPDLTLAGQPYRFKGFNIYNANSQDSCAYSMGSGSTLDRALDDIGSSRQNAFRAWFYQRLATTSAGRRDWTAFDHTLSVAEAHGQRVVVTLADQWGDCEGPAGQRDAYKDEAWYRSGYRELQPPGQPSTYRAWVEEIVRRYKDAPSILAWQLMNEAEDSESRNGNCSPSAAITLQSWVSDMAGLVKSLDQRHLLSVGTIGGGQCGSSGPDYISLHSLSTVDLCEYHDYGRINDALPVDQFNGLATRLDQCRALGKPLFVGEVGIETREAGSLQARATLVDRKLAAAFRAGVAGVLLWAWNDREHGGSSASGYDIGPGDPALEALARY